MTPPSLQDAVGRLTALLQRVDGLTGPDREVDGLLWCMFTPNRRFIKMAEQGDTWGEWEGDGRKNTLLPGAMLFERTDYKGTQGDIQRHGGRFQQFSSSPAYTASLDAALALVERCLRPPHPGMTLTLKAIYSGSREPYWYAEITWPSSERQGRATTPAIALLGALMRSLEQ